MQWVSTAAVGPTLACELLHALTSEYYVDKQIFYGETNIVYPVLMQFFDALAELDYSVDGRDAHLSRETRQRRGRSFSSRQNSLGGTKSHDDIEVGRTAQSADTSSVLWRRSWGGTMADIANLRTSPVGVRRQWAITENGEGQGGTETGAGQHKMRLRFLSVAFERCCRPVLMRLERRSVEQVSPWLYRFNEICQAKLQHCCTDLVCLYTTGALKSNCYHGFKACQATRRHEVI